MTSGTVDHAGARATASRVLDEPLPREQERDLAVHLVSCPDCRSFYDELRRIRDSVRDAPRREPPERLVDHAVARATAIVSGQPDPGSLPPQDDAESTGEIMAPEPATPVGIAPEPTAAEAGQVPLPVATPAPVQPATAEAPSPFDDPGTVSTSRRERRATRRDAGVRAKRLPWILGIVATIGIASVATLVMLRQPGVRERLLPRLPEEQVVRRQVQTAFDDVRTLQTTYRITRLGLYRQPGDNVVYAFTNATQTGRVVFEAPENLREELTLDVPGQPSRKMTTVVRGTQVETLAEEGDDTTATLVSNPAFGPPDGPLLARIGILEQAVSSVSQMLVAAPDIEVVGRTTIGEQEALRVRFRVTPSAYTRADRIEVAIDESTWIPLRVERSISRANAEALGPGEVLTEAAIDAQFAGRDRVVSELVELDGLALNEPVQPGELVLSPSDTDAPEPTDARWERTSRGTLSETLPFDPMYPASPPTGYRESALSLYAGRPQAWGPRRSFPAPEAAMQAVYSDGKTTVVVSQRRITRNADRVDGSPLRNAELPVETRQVVRSGRQLHYAVSADVPPHVYGFVGDVFVMAVGYASEDDLIRLVASLQPVEEPPEEEEEDTDAAASDTSPEQRSAG